MDNFRIGDINIEYHESRKKYNEIRIKYIAFAKDVQDEFISRYDNIFNDVQLIPRNLSRISNEYLTRISDTVVRDLVAYEIYDIDDSSFLSKYESNYLSWPEDVAIVNDQYLKIVLEEEEYKNYLNEKRYAESGRVIGGGFGLEGAIAGATIATVANVAIDLVGNITDSIYKGLTAATSKIEVRNLFSDPKTKAYISEAIFRLVFNAHYCLCDLINDSIENEKVDCISKDDENKSKSLTNNIVAGRIPQDKIEYCLTAAIILNPFNYDIYRIWANQNKKAKDDIDKIAKYFIFDVEKSETIAVENKTMHVNHKEKIIEILQMTESKDYYTLQNIPERKITNAKSVYFTDEGDECLALIDCTLMGSAEVGMVIGNKGIYYSDDQKNPFYISWEEMIANRANINKSIFGISFGEKTFSMSGSQMKKDQLLNTLQNVIDYLLYQNNIK